MAAKCNSNAGVLPEEVLEIIFSHLEPVRNVGPQFSLGEDSQHNDDKRMKTLWSACKASRAFYRIANPYLYRTLHLAGASSSPNRRLLLRSLLHNSSLAQEVRHLGVSRERWNSPSKPETRPESTVVTVFDKELQVLTARRLQSLPLSQSIREQICNGVKERILHCEIMCFAAICTRVQVLDLPDRLVEVISKHLIRLIKDISENRMTTAAAGGAFQDIQQERKADCNDIVPLPLSCVQKLIVNFAYSSSSLGNKIRISAVAPMLSLPVLEMFYGNMLDITRSDHGRPRLVAESHMLRIASLTNIRFDAEGLSDFLQGCPNLEMLILSGLHMRNGRERRFALVGRAIEEYGTKLQYLSLIPRNKFRKNREIEPLGPLTHVQSLRKLVVPDQFLLGRLADDTQYYIYSLCSLLPVSLEELQIEGGDDLFAAAFGDLLLELLIDPDFTRLRRISFRKRFWTTRDFLQQVDSGVWDSSKSTRVEIVLERNTDDALTFVSDS